MQTSTEPAPSTESATSTEPAPSTEVATSTEPATSTRTRSAPPNAPEYEMKRYSRGTWRRARL
jgi:hypothetical protein